MSEDTCGGDKGIVEGGMLGLGVQQRAAAFDSILVVEGDLEGRVGGPVGGCFVAQGGIERLPGGLGVQAMRKVLLVLRGERGHGGR